MTFDIHTLPTHSLPTAPAHSAIAPDKVAEIQRRLRLAEAEHQVWS